MSTRATTTTPRRAPLPTSAAATRATVPPDPSGLWIVPGCGNRARYAQRNWGVVRGACTTPFGRRRRRPHAPQGTFFCTLDQEVTSRISKTRYDTDGRKLTEQRRCAPTSVHVRRNQCSLGKEKTPDGQTVSRRLFDQVRNAPARGDAKVEVQRLSARAKASKQARKDRRAARVAEVTLRYQQVALPCPGAAPVELWVVHVREQQPPPRTEPLEWFLLTTLQVTSAVDATRILQWYALRWRIEEILPGAQVRLQGRRVAAPHGRAAPTGHGHQDGHRVADPVDGPARARGARPAGRPAVLRWRVARACHLRPLTQAAAAGAPRRRRRSGCAPRRVARAHTRPARRAVDVARLHPTGCHGLRLRTAGRIRMTSRSIQFSPGHPGHGQG